MADDVNIIIPKWCLGCKEKRQGTDHCYQCEKEVQFIKGHCFVLNNFKFDNAGGIANYGDGEDRDLYGYQKDVIDITETFGGFNFLVHLKENATAAEMMETFHKWSKTDFTGTKCFVVFILTHGSDDGVIYGCDNKGLRITEIISEFSSCEGIDHKLFFIQACRGDTPPEVVNYYKSSGGPSISIEDKFPNTFGGPNISIEDQFPNTFVYHSTAQKHISLVRPSGSIFVSILCQVLKQYGGEYGLTDLITIVNKNVTERELTYNNKQVRQSPEVTYTMSSEFSFGEYQGVKELDSINKRSDQLVEYKLKHKNPCFILTNTGCATHIPQCDIFSKDKKTVKETFQDLNFEVTLIDNICREDIEKTFQGVKSQDFGNQECFVCVVLSCGGFSGKRPNLFGTDGLFYTINNITRDVSGNISLINKPKIFFLLVQECERSLYLGCTAASGGKTITNTKMMKSQWADVFIYYIIMKKENDTYSPFLATLCDVLKQCSSEGNHLGDVVFRINQMLNPREFPEACHTLTRQVYFNYVGSEMCDSFPFPDPIRLCDQDTIPIQGRVSKEKRDAKVSHVIEHKSLVVTIHNAGGKEIQQMLEDCSKQSKKLYQAKKNLNVLVGGGQTKDIVSPHDWRDVWHRDLYDSYSNQSSRRKVLETEDWNRNVLHNFKVVKRFLPKGIAATSSTQPGEDWKERFKSVLKNQFEKVYFFDGYDLEEHFSFLHEESEKLRDVNDNIYEDHYENIVILLTEKNILMLIKVIELRGNDNVSNQIKGGLKRLPSDLKAFLAFHNEHFIDGEIIIYPLLAVPKVTKGEFEKLTNKDEGCKNCENYFVLFRDILCDVVKWKEWWLNLNERLRIKQRSMDENEKRYDIFLAQMIGFLSTIDIHLPSAYDDELVHSNKIFLSKVQNELLSTEHKRVIITGGYGCGKSLVCQLKLEELAHKLEKEKDMIYYLCHNTKSLVKQFMTKVVEKIQAGIKEDKQVKIFTGNFADVAMRFDMPSIPTLVDFLAKVRELKHDNILYTPHIIIDEYNAVHFFKDDAEEVSHLLESFPEESHLWISALPLRTNRYRDHEANSLNITQGYQLDYIRNMKPYNLETVFRCTENINKLMEVTKNVIKEHPTKFHYNFCQDSCDLQTITYVISSQLECSDSSESDYYYGQGDIVNASDPSDEDTCPTDGSDSSVLDSPIDVYYMVLPSECHSVQRKIVSASHPSDENTYPTDRSDASVLNSPIDLDTTEFDSRNDVDHFLKANDISHGFGTHVMSSFDFTDSKWCCHIEGKKPVLLSLTETHTNIDTIIGIYVALCKIISLEKTMALICTNVEEAWLYEQALKLAKDELDIITYVTYLPTLIPRQANSLKCDELLKCHARNIVLTDMDGVTGLEFETVVVAVTPSESFLSYALLRSLTRCQSELFFMQFATDFKVDITSSNQTDDTLWITSRIIEAWRENNLVSEITLQKRPECNCKGKDKTERLYCFVQEGNKMGKMYKFCSHQESESFKKSVSTCNHNELLVWKKQNLEFFQDNKWDF